MILDVKCAFLYCQMKRTVYIELPRQDPRWAEGGVVGVLRKAMYGTRYAPQIWQNEVRTTMESLGFCMSIFQPSVYYHKSRGMIALVHVDDFLCSGDEDDLEWLCDGLKDKYDLKRNVMHKGSNAEVRYLNRSIR